jgi:nitrilase
MRTMTVAIAQATPAVLDLEAGVAKACAWIEEAGKRGARLLGFPETWIPVYPFWADTGTFSVWGDERARAVHARFARNSLTVPSAECDAIARAARAARCAVALGASERGRSGSLYNALVVFRTDGSIAWVHRKLVPTFGERLVWGHGDAAGVRTMMVEGARVGGLICWEHWMPIPRQILHAEGEEVHVASWPHGSEVHQIASRHYAFEGRAHVLAAAAYLPKDAVPADFELPEDLARARTPLLDGGSAIIAPDASYVVEPVHGREELIVAEIDLDRSERDRLVLDTGGHYARPDLFELRVDRRRQEVVFDRPSRRESGRKDGDDQ